jgi:hypothetical protein
MLEFMLEALRQFFTYEQRLNRRLDYRHKHFSEVQKYFAALEMLRGHLYRSLSQVAWSLVSKFPRFPNTCAMTPRGACL